MSELPLALPSSSKDATLLFDLPRVKDGWLPDVLARLQIRYREIPIVFADSRKFAEEHGPTGSSRRPSPTSAKRDRSPRSR